MPPIELPGLRRAHLAWTDCPGLASLHAAFIYDYISSFFRGNPIRAGGELNRTGGGWGQKWLILTESIPAGTISWRPSYDELTRGE
jgi:hypothetical protein